MSTTPKPSPSVLAREYHTPVQRAEFAMLWLLATGSMPVAKPHDTTGAPSHAGHS